LLLFYGSFGIAQLLLPTIFVPLLELLGGMKFGFHVGRTNEVHGQEDKPKLFINDGTHQNIGDFVFRPMEKLSNGLG